MATDVLHADPPQLTPAAAAEVARTVYGVEGRAEPLVSERDQNFRLTTSDGAGWVLKVSNAAEDPGVVEMEVEAVERIAALEPTLPVPVARPTLDGHRIGRVETGDGEHLVRLLPLMPGRNPSPIELDPVAVRRIGEVVGLVSRALRGFFHPAAGRVILWDQQRLPMLFEHSALVKAGPRRELLERVIARFAERVLPALPTLRAQVIHNDLTLDNLLLGPDSSVSGIVDFGDMAHTATVLDVPATLQSLVRDVDDPFAVADAFLAGYTSVVALEAAEAELLGDLLAGRMAQTILISEFRTRRYPDNAYIRGWAKPAWTLLGQLQAVGWERSSRRLATAARRPLVRGANSVIGRAEDGDDENLRARRERILGPSLEPLSYRRPLHLVEGAGAWLVDADGRRYLDAYNNVPVVGHAHPRVVDAIARQATLLNTNTRYLHRHVVELAERIAATLPEGLDSVIFVNSGSEANDLAWRLATAATGADGGLVTEWAYHGATAAIAALSPSEWADGQQPSHIETLPAPNPYRGPYAGAADPAGVARLAVEAAVDRLAHRGHRPAALYFDSLFTADGILVPQPSVVAALAAAAQAAGALVIADEVQSGHGRTGDLWGFEAWGFTPDVVTLGKPMGNGHPVAAVVARRGLVERFAETTTYFSTFGGNPVACAAALAVLDVLEDERLAERAREVGDELRAGIGAIATRCAAIGDVRGRGLMAGVELVMDPRSREPDRDLAGRVKEAMRERGVLIGTTGRTGNVLKIRPPLCLTRDEAAAIVETLDVVLRDLT